MSAEWAVIIAVSAVSILAAITSVEIRLLRGRVKRLEEDGLVGRLAEMVHMDHARNIDTANRAKQLRIDLEKDVRGLRGELGLKNYEGG